MEAQSTNIETVVVKKLELLGMDWAMKAMRMPFMSTSKSLQQDILLAKKLINRGSEHRKFLRQITVQLEIEASMTFWFEFDTYKVGVTSNSESFWNTIGTQRIFVSDNFVSSFQSSKYLDEILVIINKYINEKSPSKESLRYLIPQGIKYRRIVTMTGEALLNIINQRQSHRLTEWIEFINDVNMLLPADYRDLFFKNNGEE